MSLRATNGVFSRTDKTPAAAKRYLSPHKARMISFWNSWSRRKVDIKFAAGNLTITTDVSYREQDQDRSLRKALAGKFERDSSNDRLPFFQRGTEVALHRSGHHIRNFGRYLAIDLFAFERRPLRLSAQAGCTRTPHWERQRRWSMAVFLNVA